MRTATHGCELGVEAVVESVVALAAELQDTADDMGLSVQRAHAESAKAECVAAEARAAAMAASNTCRSSGAATDEIAEQIEAVVSATATVAHRTDGMSETLDQVPRLAGAIHGAIENQDLPTAETSRSTCPHRRLRLTQVGGGQPTSELLSTAAPFGSTNGAPTI